MLRFLQAAIVPVLAITILAFSGDGAEAAKGVKKNSAHKIEGKVVASTVKNGKGTVTVKTHHHKKKNAAGGAANGAANAAAKAGKAANANGNVAAKGNGGKKKGHTQEFTVDNTTKISTKNGGNGNGNVAQFGGKGKGKGKGANRGGGNQIRVGDFVIATIGGGNGNNAAVGNNNKHHATSVEVMHGKGKGKKKANN